MEAPKGRSRVLTYAMRAVQVAIFVAVNYAVFFIAPKLFFSAAGLLTGEIEATISSYFLIIGCLTALHILLKDHVIGFASSVSLSIVQAIYIYVITNGGLLSITYSGFTLTLEFKPLLYLMMAVPLVSMVKQICDYAARSSAQPVAFTEVEG